MSRCRVCMADVELENRKSIFDIGVDNLRISDMIKNCTTLEILETDAFSKIICPGCLEKIINIYTFKQTVLTLNEDSGNWPKDHKCSTCKEHKTTNLDKTNTKPPREILICSICKKKFKHSRTLMKHQKVHTTTS